VTSQDGTSAGPGVEAKEDARGSEAESSDPTESSAADSFAVVIDELRRVQDQLERLLRIQVDRLKIQWRERLLLVAWVALAAVVLLTATVAAVLYAMAGLAGFVSAALGGPPWVGNLVGGATVLAVLGGGLALGGAVLRRRGLARLRDSYEKRATSGEGKEARP
jgi:hypothetical protein